MIRPTDDERTAAEALPAKRRPDPPMFPGGTAIGKEEEQAVLEVLRDQRLFRYRGPRPGPSRVDALESAFASHMGVRHALAVTSGTASLICGLRALGIGPGDEVIVPAYTWIASANAVLAVGAIPVIAEVDQSLTLDPVDAETKITPWTKAIMPVHLRGVPCRMDELLSLAQRRGLQVIEDNAQADGGSYKGRRLGTLGNVGCFSLQFNKIITCGEGGMVVSDDEQVWKRAYMFHDVIGPLRDLPADELLWGVNFRMPELTAAVALVQLGRLEGLLTAMRERKRLLKAGMAETAARKGIAFRELVDPEGDTGICLVFFAHDADHALGITQALQRENIGASVLYRPDHVDYHVYAHWIPVLAQRTWSPEDGPWRWARRPLHYSKEMCPRSLDLLGRAVHLDVSPLLENQDLEETIFGVNRVLEALG